MDTELRLTEEQSLIAEEFNNALSKARAAFGDGRLLGIDLTGRDSLRIELLQKCFLDPIKGKPNMLQIRSFAITEKDIYGINCADFSDIRKLIDSIDPCSHQNSPSSKTICV